MRISFYKSVATFVRAYAKIAQDLTTARYPDADAAALQREVEFYGDIRAGIKRHSGEELDIKPYEADLRRLHLCSVRSLSGRGQPQLALAHGPDHQDRHP